MTHGAQSRQQASYAVPREQVGCEKPPCSYLRYVVWIAVFAVTTIVLPMAGFGYSRYREARTVQQTDNKRLDVVEVRVSALEKMAESRAQTMDELKQSVARLTGKTEAVLETSQQTLAEVRSMRQKHEEKP